MDAFLAQIAAYDAQVLVDTWGDAVVYKPYGGTPRTIQAVIDRDPSVTENGSPPHAKMRMTCRIDPVHGVDPGSVKPQDRVSASYPEGSPVQDWTIVRCPEAQTPGMWTAYLI